MDTVLRIVPDSSVHSVVKLPVDARERSSWTSSYCDPAFPHL